MELRAGCREPFESNGDAKRQLFDHIEVFYNQKRRHSAAGRMSPAAFEPPHRLVITWAYPGRVVDEVELRLSPDGDGAVLELEHRSGDNTEWWIGAGSGWEHAFVRLSVLLQGNDPAAVSGNAMDVTLGPLWVGVVVSDHANTRRGSSRNRS